MLFPPTITKNYLKEKALPSGWLLITDCKLSPVFGIQNPPRSWSLLDHHNYILARTLAIPFYEKGGGESQKECWTIKQKKKNPVSRKIKGALLMCIFHWRPQQSSTWNNWWFISESSVKMNWIHYFDIQLCFACSSGVPSTRRTQKY